MYKCSTCASRRAAQKAARHAFSTSACMGEEKIIMNRYSRNITSTKDQGASQACYSQY